MRRRSWWAALAVLLLAVTIAIILGLHGSRHPRQHVVEPPEIPAVQPQFVERLVADLGPPAPAGVERVWRSPDGTKQAYVTKRGWDSFLVVNGVEGPPYDEIRAVAFSPDGKRLAYLASRSEKHLVVCDGQEGPMYEYVEWLRFSPDSSRLAYLATKWPLAQWERFFVVCDGAEGVEFSGRLSGPKFSPDSKHLAYEGHRENKAFVVIDGVQGPSHERVNLLGASETLRYGVWDGCDIRVMETSWPTGEDLSQYKIVEKEVSLVARMPVPHPGGVSWGGSGDALTMAVTITHKGKQSVFIEGKQSPQYEKVRALKHSPDYKHVAYAVTRDGKQLIVKDYEEGAPYDEVGNPVFSPDSVHLAYKAKRGDKWLVVCDGKQGSAFDALADPVFSQDGRCMAYLATRGEKKLVICQDRQTPEYDQVRDLVLSPDGRHLAFAASRGEEWFMVCDGIEGPKHAKVWRDRQITQQALTPQFIRYLVIDGNRESLVELAWPTNLDWTNALSVPPQERATQP